MQDAASIDVAVQPDDRDGACDVIMSDLPGNEDNIIALDDGAPRQAKAGIVRCRPGEN